MISPLWHLDEPGTAGYPAIAAINMLRAVFAQRIFCARRVRHDLREMPLGECQERLTDPREPSPLIPTHSATVYYDQEGYFSQLGVADAVYNFAGSVSGQDASWKNGLLQLREHPRFTVSDT